MTKNIRANITLIFSINKKNTELQKALDSISRQTDKNFNIIFVFSCEQSEYDTFKKFNFNDVNDIKYVFLSENLGDAFTLNSVIKNNLTTEYFYHFDSNIILLPDFVLTLNKFLEKHQEADVVSFLGVPNIYFKEEYLQIKSLSDDFCRRPLVFLNNQLINKEFIKKHNISQTNFKYYPILDYISIAKNNPKWYFIGRQICSFSIKPCYSFNVLDLFDQCHEVLNMADHKWFNDHYSEIEYLCIVMLFRNFIYAFFSKNKTNFILLKRILNKIEDFIDINFPKWEKNEWLYSKKNKNDESYLKYLREFKPKLIHILKAFYNKLFVQGYAKHK